MQWSAVLLEFEAWLVQSSRQQAADSTCSVAVPIFESLSIAVIS